MSLKIMIDSGPSTTELGMATGSVIPARKVETNIQAEAQLTRGIVEYNEWEVDDSEVLTKSVKKAEELLGIERPYKMRLFRNKVVVTDNSGQVGTVDDGALIVTKDGDATVILVSENLGKPSKYSLSSPDGTSVVEQVTTRDEEVIIAAGEELFHLSDELRGELPTIIDPSAEYEGKYEQKHEKNAALFRISLLASMKSERWKKFQDAIDNAQSYTGGLRLHWEKTEK